jgi:hypothetical protein
MDLKRKKRKTKLTYLPSHPAAHPCFGPSRPAPPPLSLLSPSHRQVGPACRDLLLPQAAAPLFFPARPRRYPRRHPAVPGRPAPVRLLHSPSRHRRTPTPPLPLPAATTPKPPPHPHAINGRHRPRRPPPQPRLLPFPLRPIKGQQNPLSTPRPSLPLLPHRSAATPEHDRRRSAAAPISSSGAAPTPSSPW